MLRDTITYGGQKILTVYHENSELDVPGRFWQEREKIGRFWLEFQESSGHSEDEFPPKEATVERALLPYDHPLSPSGAHELCTLMLRQRFSEKPNYIFLPDTSGIRLNKEEWEALCKFVKRYVGVDLSKYPLACGDTFLFHYVQLRYHESKQHTIVVDPSSFDRIDIHFKRESTICESQTRIFPPDNNTETEFVPVEDWDTFDIFAYDGEELWFYAKDVCFIHSVSLSMKYSENQKVALKQSGYTAEYANHQQPEIIKIGEEKSSLRLMQNQLQRRILSSLNQHKKTSYLVQKGNDRIAYNLANKLLDQRWDEVRLFDPYLLDKKGKGTLVDWMQLLCASPTKKIYAIYYAKPTESALTIADTKTLFSKDWILSQEFRKKPNAFHLVGLSECIHDRFLLCRANNNYEGIILGTSLNSLNNNYFCVHVLTPDFAQECWEIFDKLIELHTTEIEVM